MITAGLLFLLVNTYILGYNVSYRKERKVKRSADFTFTR